MTTKDTPEYRRNYLRGWRSSATSDNGLERADMRGESDAWYDGYLDYAAGREKWHMLNCPNHNDCKAGL